MWLVLQLTVNEPFRLTVEWAVSAHFQPVWWPSRCTSTVVPASDAGALPLNDIWLERKAEARVWIVMPLPLAETTPLPVCTPALPDPLLDALDPPTPPPPEL